MASSDDDFCRIQFKSPDQPDKDWEDWFREYHARKVMRVEFDPAPDVPLQLSGTVLALPGSAVSEMSIVAGISRQLAVADSDDMCIVAALSGKVATLDKGDHVEIGGGTVAIGRNDEAGYLNLQTTSQLFTICLKRSMIEPFVPNLSDVLTVPYCRDSAAMRLLFAYARILTSSNFRDGPELHHVISTHLHDLAALALGASRDGAAVAQGRGVRTARLAAIKSDILRDLANPNLSASTVAARHGVTPRYVHMLFEAEGVTFSEYVVEQRLAWAHRLLGDPRFANETIGAIAMKVGFGDLSYFNRTFRARFGATPSDVRAAARRSSD